MTSLTQGPGSIALTTASAYCVAPLSTRCLPCTSTSITGVDAAADCFSVPVLHDNAAAHKCVHSELTHQYYSVSDATYSMWVLAARVQAIATAVLEL
eukprot:7494-Heterococcus_DN1.PRE.1